MLVLVLVLVLSVGGKRGRRQVDVLRSLRSCGKKKERSGEGTYFFAGGGLTFDFLDFVRLRCCVLGVLASLYLFGVSF